MKNLIGIGLMALMAGCATTGLQQAKGVVDSLQKTRDDVVIAEEQIEAAGDTLAQIAAGDTNVTAAQLKDDLKSIEKHAELARKQANLYRKTAKKYVDSWDDNLNDIEDPILRAQSNLRRGAVVKDLRALELYSARTRQAYGPMIVQLEGLARDFGDEITPDEIEELQPRTHAALVVAEELQLRIRETLAVLDIVSGTLISEVP